MRNLNGKNFWKNVWEKHRIRISQAGGFLLIWIAKPRSNALFILGLLIALIGEAIRFWSAGHIRKGTELARSGPYAMVRNPLYFGSFVMSCGFALMCTTLRHWLSTAVIWSVVMATFYWLYPKKIAIEEYDLDILFKDGFAKYRQEVPVFWPDLNLWQAAINTNHWNFKQAIKNKEHKTFWAVCGLILVLRFKMVYH